MKTKNRNLLLLLSMCVFILLIFLCQSFIKGCFWWNCVPERDFHVLDWELPSDFFPSDTYLSHISPSSEGSGEIERGGQVIYWNKNHGVAIYGIKRYPTINDAIRDYEYLAKEENKKESDFGQNEIPHSQSYRSETADKFLIVCVNQERKSCNMIARYQEYVIRFFSVIDDNMTYSDFEKVLFYIDDQISNRLYP